MQRPHLYLMERKSNTARWRGDVGSRRGSTGRGKRGDSAGCVDANITGPQNKKIHAIDSPAINER
jgi:hypothetical protein